MERKIERNRERGEKAREKERKGGRNGREGREAVCVCVSGTKSHGRKNAP
jgi:hypothetical protein